MTHDRLSHPSRRSLLACGAGPALLIRVRQAGESQVWSSALTGLTGFIVPVAL